MPISVQWDNTEETTLCITVEGFWRIEDYYHQYAHAARMMTAADGPVALIIDMDESAPPPGRLLSTANFSKNHRPPNLKMTVFVGAPRIVEVLANLMARIILSSDKLAFANSLDEARQLTRACLAE